MPPAARARPVLDIARHTGRALRRHVMSITSSTAHTIQWGGLQSFAASYSVSVESFLASEACLTGSYETGRIDQAEVRTKCANSILVREACRQSSETACHQQTNVSLREVRDGMSSANQRLSQRAQRRHVISTTSSTRRWVRQLQSKTRIASVTATRHNGQRPPTTRAACCAARML